MTRDRKGRFATKSQKAGMKVLGYGLLAMAAWNIALAANAHIEPTPLVVEQIQEEVYKEVKIEVAITWDTNRIIEEIKKTFPEDPRTAVAIAKAESELNIRAYNPEAHRGCNGSFGIMQIACVHSAGDLYDVQENLRVARAIYDANGWKRWGAYTDKRYLEFLN